MSSTLVTNCMTNWPFNSNCVRLGAQ